MSSGSALRIVKHSHDVTEYRVLATSMWGFWMWLIILSVVVIISPVSEEDGLNVDTFSFSYL